MEIGSRLAPSQALNQLFSGISVMEQNKRWTRMREEGLSDVEIDHLARQGWTGPFALCAVEDMALVRKRILDEVIAITPSVATNEDVLRSRHMDSPVVREICRSVAIVERLRSVLGDDILLWNTYFWNKLPGSLGVGWHQDLFFYSLDPSLTLSVWLAVDSTDPANGCLRLIPGSHRFDAPHIPTDGTSAFTMVIDSSVVELGASIDVPLEAGQFIIFDGRLIHSSYPNRTSNTRLGLALRVTFPHVRISHESPPLFAGHRAILLSGQDRYGHNQLMDAID